MNKHYYPTTPLTHDQLIGAQRVAKTQDERVLALFRTYRHRALSASQVKEAIDRIHRESGCGPAPLITSVRRSLSTLSAGDDSPLERLTTTIQGPHGRPETQYKLRGS